MKNRTSLVIGALMISLLAGCSKRPMHSAWTSSDSMVVEPGVSVGPVHSGMTIQQVVAELGEPDQKQDAALIYRKLGVALVPGHGDIVQTVLCSAGGDAEWKLPDGNTIFTKSFSGHTKEGIGIGARSAEVVKAYGKPTTVESDQKLRLTIMRYDPLGVIFTLRDDKVVLIEVSFKP